MKKLFKRTYTYRRLEHMPYNLHWMIILGVVSVLGVGVFVGGYVLFGKVSSGTLYKTAPAVSIGAGELFNERLLTAVVERIETLGTRQRDVAQNGIGVRDPRPRE